MTKEALIAGMSRAVNPRSRWWYALTMPVFLMFFNYLMVGPGFINNWEIFVGSILLNGCLLTVTFLIQTKINENIAQRYPRLDHTVKRIFVSIVAHAVLSGVFLLLIAWLYIGFGFFGSTLTFPRILTIYLINVGGIMLVMGIQESFNAIDRWKHHEVNRERLMKENVNGQLESLKAQVSPHFLFNTLNSLSTLIAEDPQKAEQFVDEMAKVYRYLLQTNHASQDDSEFSQLTTLQKELSFIESYGHLLKTRYGDGMKLYIHVEAHLLNRRIPPLTLQLLVENAVKHNVIRASRPLTIFILSTQDGNLMVRNNLQKKTITAGAENLESTGVGLVNILTKYKLFNDQQKNISQPLVESNHEFFTVILPLIA